ncbi:hypothetical protein K4L06_21050 [Lysobacter sp. BMK333-48F3]|uniref:hypothetical protein n=1 Tax=Lysobacter sp. BMK333-48F3 TaxID=2867962 RepID=UPI001C8CF0E5|nr:hypothetical protein [Lysobacter sp. BMK333-48F3]MBX9403801.1 hypothetical protein [Lysobacter sp. BMK333-48F3]
MTFCYKKVFPAFFLGLPSLSFLYLLFNEPAGSTPVLVLPLMIAVGFFVVRRYTADLADEVLDDGDKLKVRKGGLEQTVALRDIVDVSVTRNTNPARLSLRLDRAGALGDRIAFVPLSAASDCLPYKPNPLAGELKQRIATIKATSMRQP